MLHFNLSEFFTFVQNLNMKNIIEAAWENRSLLEEKQTQDTIRSIITQLDEGTVSYTHLTLPTILLV